MKKVIFGAAVLALAALGVFKATETNNYAFSDLQMENIEMLAEGEWTGRWDDPDQPCDGNPDWLCWVQGNKAAKIGDFLY